MNIGDLMPTDSLIFHIGLVFLFSIVRYISVSVSMESNHEVKGGLMDKWSWKSLHTYVSCLVETVWAYGIGASVGTTST